MGANAAETFWDTLDPYSQCRVSSLYAAPPDATASPGISRSAGPGRVSEKVFAKVWHPDNPLFWFAALGGVTVLAMATSSGTVSAGARAKVGPVAAEAEVGNQPKE
ncbi:MAG: hypothetical protein ACRDOE_00540 [Streptosporangiaceae bacterium]